MHAGLRTKDGTIKPEHTKLERGRNDAVSPLRENLKLLPVSRVALCVVKQKVHLMSVDELSFRNVPEMMTGVNVATCSNDEFYT
jgi:hypothetical protein